MAQVPSPSLVERTIVSINKDPALPRLVELFRDGYVDPDVSTGFVGQRNELGYFASHNFTVRELQTISAETVAGILVSLRENGDVDPQEPLENVLDVYRDAYQGTRSLVSPNDFNWVWLGKGLHLLKTMPYSFTEGDFTDRLQRYANLDRLKDKVWRLIICGLLPDDKNHFSSFTDNLAFQRSLWGAVHSVLSRDPQLNDDERLRLNNLFAPNPFFVLVLNTTQRALTAFLEDYSDGDLRGKFQQLRRNHHYPG